MVGKRGKQIGFANWLDSTPTILVEWSAGPFVPSKCWFGLALDTSAATAAPGIRALYRSFGAGDSAPSADRSGSAMQLPICRSFLKRRVAAPYACSYRGDSLHRE